MLEKTALRKQRKVRCQNTQNFNPISLTDWVEARRSRTNNHRHYHRKHDVKWAKFRKQTSCIRSACCMLYQPSLFHSMEREPRRYDAHWKLWSSKQTTGSQKSSINSSETHAYNAPAILLYLKDSCDFAFPDAHFATICNFYNLQSVYKLIKSVPLQLQLRHAQRCQKQIGNA